MNGIRPCGLILAGSVLLAAFAASASAAILHVGPTRRYKKPCAAIAVASPGDVIEIDPVLYRNDSCAWRTSDLTLKGLPGPGNRRPHIDDSAMTGKGSHPHLAEYKGIWVFYGRNTVIENIEFSGANIPYKNGNNGSGLRASGKNFTVLNCYFHNNQDGILEGNVRGSKVVIKYSEFSHNGAGDGYSHNIYIGHAGSLLFEFNYSRAAVVGHLLKSRAAVNYILYNRLSGENGTDSYELDLPNGGTSYIIGNLIEQGPKSQNPVILNYLEEGRNANSPGTHLDVVNNTFVNQDPAGGTFVHAGSADTTPMLLENNIFYGPGTVTNQRNAILKSNFRGDPHFANLSAFDYQLTPGSPAINAGIEPGTGNGFELLPKFQYVQPACGERRQDKGRIDIGAYEFGGAGPMLHCR